MRSKPEPGVASFNTSFQFYHDWLATLLCYPHFLTMLNTEDIWNSKYVTSVSSLPKRCVALSWKEIKLTWYSLFLTNHIDINYLLVIANTKKLFSHLSEKKVFLSEISSVMGYGSCL